MGALSDIEPQPDQSLIAISRRTLVHQIMLVVINQPSFLPFLIALQKNPILLIMKQNSNFLADLVHSQTKL